MFDLSGLQGDPPDRLDARIVAAGDVTDLDTLPGSLGEQEGPVSPDSQDSVQPLHESASA